MIIPITSAICRELFLRVPRDLTDGALALGSTRWESIRGVMLAYAAPGIVAAVLLGLGRAFGEAIAVNQTIGNHNAIPTSWSAGGLARQQDRLGVRRRDEPRAGVVDPLLAAISCHLARDEYRRPVRRRSLRAREGCGMSAVPSAVDPYDITVRSNGLRRRRITEKLFGRSPSRRARRVRDPRCRPGHADLQGRKPAEPQLLHEACARSSVRRAASRTPWWGRRDRRHGDAHRDPVAVLVAIYMSEYAAPSSRACESFSTS